MFVLGVRRRMIIGRYQRTEASSEPSDSSDGSDERGPCVQGSDGQQSQFRESKH